MHKMVKRVNSDCILIWGHSRPVVLIAMPTARTCVGKAVQWAATPSTE